MSRDRFNPLMFVLMMLLPMAAAGNDPFRDLPVDIQADSVAYDPNRGATHLRNNVRIARGDLVVHAEEGFAFQTEGRLERVELNGNPARWQLRHQDGSEAEGEADQIIYSAGSNSVTMIGNARARDPRGSFSGQRLVYDIDTQAAEGDGGVRMILEPEVRADPEGP